MAWMLGGMLAALSTSVPLAWKWQLGIARTIAVVLTFGALNVAVLASLGVADGIGEAASAVALWLMTVGAAALLLAYRFYRDPDRRAPNRTDAVVSPADGIVVYVRRSRAGLLPVSNKHGQPYPLTELTRTPLQSEDAVVIGIAMSFADVHVNRAPVEGNVILRRHFPGRFGSLRQPETVFENERATTVIQGKGLQVAVVQIASRLVRQIASYVREGERVVLGQRLGVIRLGSQVDLVLPARHDLRITTQVGERLRAGESIVAVLENRSAAGSAALNERTSDCRGALVIGEHVRGLGLVRSLGRRGIRVWTLEPEGETLASRSRYSRKTLRWPADETEQIDYLFALAARHQLDGWAVFATNDETTALLAKHHATLSQQFRLTVPPWDAMAWAYDKRRTHALATEVRVHQPKTFFPMNRDELSTLECSFPLVLKPAFKKEVNQFTHDKAWPVDDRQSLLSRYDEACRLVGADVVIAQELIPGGGESQFSFAALAVDGRVVASLTARRTRQYPVDFGHSSTFVETTTQPSVEAAAARLLRATRYTGLVEIEFKYDARDGRFKLLDVNPRVWTWHAVGGRAGVDFSYLLWRVVNGEHVPELRGQPGVRWMRVSADMAAAATEMARGRLSPSSYVRSFSGPLEFATFAIDDPIPAVTSMSRFAASICNRLFSSMEAHLRHYFHTCLHKPA